MHLSEVTDLKTLKLWGDGRQGREKKHGFDAHSAVQFQQSSVKDLVRQTGENIGPYLS